MLSVQQPSTMSHVRPRPRHYQSGFTLIEVMVVVVILAVMSALIVGSIQGDVDRNAKIEAQRFIAVVNEMRDEAVISGKTVIMRMDDRAKSYSFDVLSGSAEQEQNSFDRLFRTRKLHESVKLKWEVFEEFDRDDEDEFEANQEEDDDDSPRVFITALGELTPFQARFGGEENDFVVELDDDGNLKFDIKKSNFF